MGKLAPSQVDEYLAVHLPYRTRIMLAHYKMTHDRHGNAKSWTGELGPSSWLEACFEASLIAGRMYLNLLGIAARKDGSALRIVGRRESDDLGAEDLGGVPLELAMLPLEEQSLLLDFIVMANKASAHLTTLGNHDPEKAHPAILRVHSHLKKNVYDAAGRTGLEPPL